ncbi:MAG TPA: GNAT family N-acetyltransferase [Blastocatellia bacterium]|nr:GNAT family N-acetyltransferase [Blastocatellia bacterium]
MTANEQKQILVRPATLEDKEVFLSLLGEFAEYEKLTPPDEAAQRRLIEDGFGPRRRFEVLLAEFAGQVAGYAIVYDIYSSFLARPKLYLEDLFVKPDFRGCGVGKALFEACVRETESRGFDRLQWYVEDWNEQAVRFYEQMGARRLNWQTWQLDCQPPNEPDPGTDSR